MKFTHKLMASLMALFLTIPVCMSGCNQSSDVLYYEYDYDLSEYITLGEYKGITVTGSNVEVTEEDMQMQIQAILTDKGQSVNIGDRALEAGDTVIYRCTVTLDGEVIPELCEESGTFILGAEYYGQDIDNVLIGAKEGETVYAKRTLDVVYGEYAGKTVDYEIYVLGGYNIVLPNYTDEFVKTYLGYDSIEAFEASIYEKLYTFRQENYKNHLVSATWNVVMENTTVLDYPEKELEEVVSYYVEDVKSTAAAVNIKYEEYLNAIYGQTPEEFENSMKEQAKEELKADMIVYAIARAENLSVSEEKYQEYLSRFIQMYDDFMYTYEVENTFGKELLMSEVLKEVVKEYVAEVANIIIPDTAETNA